MTNETTAQILDDDERIAAILPAETPPSPTALFLLQQGRLEGGFAAQSLRHSIENVFDTILGDVEGADELNESDFVETFGDFVVEHLCDDPVAVRDFLSNVAQYVDDYCDEWRALVAEAEIST